jgi:putative ABC transport system substrate-binding protein
MRRRDFLLLAASTAMASERAWPADKIPRIGVIGAGSRQANQRLVQALRDGLGALGWIDGRNLVIVDRWAEGGTKQLPGVAGQLIGSSLDILVTVGTAATRAASVATATIPIVLVGVGDSVALGVVNSLARPGGNATGLSLSSIELIVKRLQLLQELVPGLSRIAVIARNDPGLEQTLLDIRINADRMGLKVQQFVAPTGRALELTFNWLRSDRCDALYLASGPLGPAKRAEIIALAAESRIPAIYSYRVFAVAGGLMSFAADDNDLFRRAAIFVDEILKGANPADLPVEEPAKFELIINLKTAKALGLTVPQSLLARADEVIE